MDIRKLANPVRGLSLKTGWDVLAAVPWGFYGEWPGLVWHIAKQGDTEAVAAVEVWAVAGEQGGQ